MDTKQENEKPVIPPSLTAEKAGSTEFRLDALEAKVKKLNATFALLEKGFSSLEENTISRLSDAEHTLRNLSYRYNLRFGSSQRNCPACGKLQIAFPLREKCEACGVTLES